MNLGDNVTKGMAIKKTLNFIKSVNKNKITTIAVGDNQNDLSMLKVVNIPVLFQIDPSKLITKIKSILIKRLQKDGLRWSKRQWIK